MVSFAKVERPVTDDAKAIHSMATYLSGRLKRGMSTMASERTATARGIQADQKKKKQKQIWL